jgi:methenyltetrahydromethanopterin cyclohydrolase
MELNKNSMEIAADMIGRTVELGIEGHELENGTKILDCGVHVAGSLEAGRLFASACLGGLGDVWISPGHYGELTLPTIKVEIEKPSLPCLGSQKAGWKIRVGDFFGMGSGPARMLLSSAKQEFMEVSNKAVLALESSMLPDEEVSQYVADKCGVSPESLALLVTRTASLAGSTQVSARMVETALYKMEHLGIKAKVLKGSGAAPIAPVIGDDVKMMGVSNDMIIYGSNVHLTVEGDVEIDNIPSKASPEYGRPFFEIFKESGYDFYKIDQSLFAPAEIEIEKKGTIELKRAGEINTSLIGKTLKSQ